MFKFIFSEDLHLISFFQSLLTKLDEGCEF
jgi:hypothetical protein